MNSILNDTSTKCECFDCRRDAPFHPNYCQVLRNILPDDPKERCRFMQKLYYFKPFARDSWTKDWKSVTHRDFTFREDLWSIRFPAKDLDLRPGFEEYTCRKWCKGEHNEPLPAGIYSAATMPDLFERPRRGIYSDPRPCNSTYEQDYTWKDDYRPKPPFPGWCLRGYPPRYLDEDRTS